MLRKLVISLLILSALTTEGIINIADILCDPSILTKEVINLVLGCEGELQAAQLKQLNKKPELKLSSALFSSIKFSNCSYEPYAGTNNIKSFALFDKRILESVRILMFLFVILIAVLKTSEKDILFYRSDLSPPVVY